MSDLISREEAINAFRKELCKTDEHDMVYAIGFGGIERIINKLPSIYAVNHTADYDEKNDILFVHLSPDNSNSYGEEIDKNIIIMRDMDSNEITGVMLYGFNKYIKHGRWIEIKDDVFASTYKCSECGRWPLIEDCRWALTDYCPHCGARMDAERKEP